MLPLVILSCLFAQISCAERAKPGNAILPSNGELWPLPYQHFRNSTVKGVSLSSYEITVTGTDARSEKLLKERTKKSLDRIQASIVKHYGPQDESGLNKLKIQFIQTKTEKPRSWLDINENYKITVIHYEHSETYLIVHGETLNGLIKGYISSLHLPYIVGKKSVINATHIVDRPRYRHRGLLLDTSRHYISLQIIKDIIISMTASKLNALHWHIVDDQSFPYHSEAHPKLSELGAYHPRIRYSRKDILTIYSFGRGLGVRVILEFDVPGHTRSWGHAYPEILTECYKGPHVTGLGPMNPLREQTYKILGDVLIEAQKMIQDEFIHLGGNDVDYDCWTSNAEILKYMQDNKLSPGQLHSQFLDKVMPFFKTSSIPVVWQDVFDNNATLRNDTIVQVYKDDWEEKIKQVVDKGHRVILSSGWNLNETTNWEDLYNVKDPRDVIGDPEKAELIIGGEASLWTETVDDSNVISRAFMAASVVAEKLWSPFEDTRIANETVRSRLERHYCVVYYLTGVETSAPNGPGFCHNDLRDMD